LLVVVLAAELVGVEHSMLEPVVRAVLELQQVYL
tara:strand:+ start:35 stop:136 length:102 start_codon:yes stop_codon:yes gene_type:complete